MEQLDKRVQDALYDQLEVWASSQRYGNHYRGTSPIYAWMAGTVRAPRTGSVALVSDAQELKVERAMAAVKREAPEQYRVLKAEAYSLLGEDDQLTEQRGRARNAQMSLRSYQRYLPRARVFLAALLFGPRQVTRSGELTA
ncbi:hypothetical protein [Microbulbifer sp. ALW1]|uniref:hypothetical protein n=1 Tax=Microbulbifer sp. (strain ALW1) TaxID=1516059 RepID=UPI001358C99F|nr:hypothetical protein [Microbulbifer sp. ALW1]